VLPPPPRYPAAGYPGAPGGGQLIETNNTLTHPTGPEYQLVVGEGMRFEALCRPCSPSLAH